MRPIDRFILHVVHNWKNELNEAYSEKAIKDFIQKFRNEADDFNIKISDEQLRKYIERFDDLKNSPKITEKDLNKWTIGQLIRLITASDKGELPEETLEDNTPDVVYNEAPFTIWNGAKKDNCITYGRGEKWCITRSGNTNWDNYRYGSGEPTFYLVKNSNLSDSNILSFVAIQVLNNGKYKFTNRDNKPGMEGPFSWSELNSKIPWLSEIPNIKTILKYIPLSSQEKTNNLYKNRSIPIRQWEKEPFSVKKQYLIARGQGGGSTFYDITDEEFLSNYLPEYPQLISIYADNPDLVNSVYLLKNLEKYPENERKSITANLHKKIDTKYLSTNILPFNVRKLLVKLDKWELEPNERLYVTKDGSTIVLLELDNNDITINLFQDKDDYPNIKLNQRTSKYLLDYPELDKIPLKTMFNLANKNIISNNVINNIIEKAKNNPNSALIIKPTEDGQIIIDTNTLSSYKLNDKGTLSNVPFSNDKVQNILSGETNNKALQQNSLNIFKTNKNIPSSLDKNNLHTIIDKIPYNQRIIPLEDNISGVLLTTDDTYFVMPVTIPNDPEIKAKIEYDANGGLEKNPWRGLNSEQIESYFKYLRATNQAYTAQQLKRALQSTFGFSDYKKTFIEKNPPIVTDSYLQPLISNDIAYLVNINNPRESFKISDRSGKLLKASLPANIVTRLGRNPVVPAAAPAAQGAGQAVVAPLRQRGRPVGGGQPRVAAPAGGNINIANRMGEAGLIQGFNALPIAARRRINVEDAVNAPIANNRGASRRNNLLGNVGRVTAVYEIGDSAIYIITLANDTQVASVVVQPGNNHYLVTPQSAYSLESPSQLRAALQQRGLAENIKKAVIKLYLAENPNMLGETIDMIKQLQNEMKIIPASFNQEEIDRIYRERKCLEILQDKTKKKSEKLNLKIGKYNLSGEEKGVEMTWDEGQSFLSSVTKRNAENLFNKLNIIPENVYIGVVPTRCAYSYYITGTYNNEGIAIARKETSNNMAGQTYLVTPNLKKQLSKLDIEYNVTDLEEIKINPVGPVRILPKDDIDIIDSIIDGKIRLYPDDSGNAYEPNTVTYSQESFCNRGVFGSEDQCNALKTLLAKYPKGAKFVSNDFATERELAPGASLNSFTDFIKIEDNKLIIQFPYISNPDEFDVIYLTGWFDINGQYHPDTKNFDKKGNYIGSGLEEIKITPIGMGRILPKEDVKLIDILTDSFGEGDSGFDLYEPMSERYDLDLCDDEWRQNGEKCKAVKTLLAKYPNGGTFVSNDTFANFPCPGAPPNSFEASIKIDAKNKTITISTPYINTNGEYGVGWFDARGNYYPDTAHFNDDGEYLG